MNEEEILKELLGRAKRIGFNNKKELDDIRRKGKMALHNLFPLKSYWIEIGNIKFEQIHYSEIPEYKKKQEWSEGQDQLINLLDTALLDIKTTKNKQNKPLQQLPQIKEKIVFQDKIIPVIDESAIRELKEQFAEYKRNVKNWVIYAILALLMTSILWILYYSSGWESYNAHEKKLSITLLTNLILIIGLLHIPIKRQWTLWIPGIIAGLITVLSLI